MIQSRVNHLSQPTPRGVVSRSHLQGLPMTGTRQCTSTAQPVTVTQSFRLPAIELKSRGHDRVNNKDLDLHLVYSETENVGDNENPKAVITQSNQLGGGANTYRNMRQTGRDIPEVDQKSDVPQGIKLEWVDNEDFNLQNSTRWSRSNTAKPLNSMTMGCLQANENSNANKSPAQTIDQNANANTLPAQIFNQNANATKLPTQIVNQNANDNKLPTPIFNQNANANTLPTQIFNQNAKANKLPAQIVNQNANANTLPAQIINENANANKHPAQIINQTGNANKLPVQIFNQNTNANKLPGQIFNQNANANNPPANETQTTEEGPYYLENFHDMASCSCDMGCFQFLEETPSVMRTFKRPDTFHPYESPRKYKAIPPAGFMMPKFRRNRFPAAWGVPTCFTNRTPKQTKYPLPSLNYPYILMSQSIFKHYEMHEKNDTPHGHD